MSHGHDAVPARRAALAVLTVSDTRTLETDVSGRTIRARLDRAGHRTIDHRIVPDEPDAVAEQIRAWLAREDCDGVIVSGGTGISRRDRTAETVAGLLDVELEGFGELFRALSFREVGSAAMLSRALGGIAAGKLVFALPGSSAAVELALDELILPELGHLLAELSR